MPFLRKAIFVSLTFALMCLAPTGVATVQAQLGSLDTHMLSIFQGRSRVNFEQKWSRGGRSRVRRDSPAAARGRRVIAAGQATTHVGPVDVSSDTPAFMARRTARDASTRRTHAQTLAQWLQQYPELARRNGFDPDDLSDTTAMCLVACYSVSAGQATTSQQEAGTRRTVREVLLKNPEVQGVSAAEKRRQRDMLAITVVGAYKGIQGTPDEQAEARRTAEQVFTALTGYPPSRVQATADGLRVH